MAWISATIWRARSQKSARDVFFYYSGPRPSAVRYKNWKIYFTMVSDAPAGFLAGPLPYAWAQVVNIKRDPFETSVGDQIKTLTGMGGAISSPSTAYVYDWNILPHRPGALAEGARDLQQVSADAGPGKLQPGSGHAADQESEEPSEPVARRRTCVTSRAARKGRPFSSRTTVARDSIERKSNSLVIRARREQAVLDLIAHGAWLMKRAEFPTLAVCWFSRPPSPCDSNPRRPIRFHPGTTAPQRRQSSSSCRPRRHKAAPKFVPPAERIATFDQDGTLWVEHPMYSQVMYCLDRVPALVKAKPELAKVEPFKTVMSGDREAIAKLPKERAREDSRRDADRHDGRAVPAPK